MAPVVKAPVPRPSPSIAMFADCFQKSPEASAALAAALAPYLPAAAQELPLKPAGSIAAPSSDPALQPLEGEVSCAPALLAPQQPLEPSPASFPCRGACSPAVRSAAAPAAGSPLTRFPASAALQDSGLEHIPTPRAAAAAQGDLIDLIDMEEAASVESMEAAQSFAAAAGAELAFQPAEEAAEREPAPAAMEGGTTPAGERVQKGSSRWPSSGHGHPCLLRTAAAAVLLASAGGLPSAAPAPSPCTQPRA